MMAGGKPVETTTTSNPICPFTLKPLAAIEREDLAIIHRDNPLVSPSSGVDSEEETIPCGHSCTLSHLIPYLHDSVGSKSCPVCQSSPASVICDANSSAYLLQQRAGSQSNGKDEAETPDSDSGGGRIISFRYGTTFYFLWVYSTPPSPPSSYSKIFSAKKVNALDRIGSVLGMDVKDGLKVIHKGKILYPEGTGKKENSDANDISEQLLDISYTDLIHRRKKPSLVVMGLRQPTTAAKKGNCSSLAFIFSVVRRLTPLYFWNMFTWGFQFTFRTTVSLIGGISLFIRSILYPPRPTQP